MEIQKEIIIFQNDQLLNLLNENFFNIQGNQNVYYKFQNIEAIKCEINQIGSIVETITSDGLETINKIKNCDDFLIKNQTNANEQYIIPFNKFNDKYELFNISDDNNSDNKWKLYKPKNNENNKIKAIKVNKEILNFLKINNKNIEIRNNNNNNLLYEFYLIASWGEKMIFKENDYLVIPLIKNNEIYRISNKEFNETYKLLLN
ncbi:hypothetical protein DDB_G0293842 [Dictyostelium discoideum AX4]|uniref:Uncharacterized protein n=1 Tax=Dictyostelium discoideum TaxID=44689 RepID=Q54B84_DICDI|nr:hypothetical protein DDB_G0293842 [Dictyostelium discoideum AX4]EAL60524.1 hypothetical protein DDB_G0293842 [Dictyostelium discoideum AX4]|eukprot:XP_628936.1 hypothetical protein DDB_G0293842 [Dictyostelium discoideum AX4]